MDDSLETAVTLLCEGRYVCSHAHMRVPAGDISVCGDKAASLGRVSYIGIRPTYASTDACKSIRDQEHAASRSPSTRSRQHERHRQEPLCAGRPAACAARAPGQQQVRWEGRGWTVLSGRARSSACAARAPALRAICSQSVHQPACSIKFALSKSPGCPLLQRRRMPALTFLAPEARSRPSIPRPPPPPLAPHTHPPNRLPTSPGAASRRSTTSAPPPWTTPTRSPPIPERQNSASSVGSPRSPSSFTQTFARALEAREDVDYIYSISA